MSVLAKDIKESQYYVWYLGWTPCKGIIGRQFVEPGLRQLLTRINRNPSIQLVKLTVRVNRKTIKIVQETKSKAGKIEKIKFPNIPAADVAFACQGSDKDSDIVCVIYLGFNPQTQSAVHVHAYRCDSPDTAAVMAGHFQQIAHLPENRDRLLKIEKELVEKGQIYPRTHGGMLNPDPQPGNKSTGSTGSSSGHDNPQIPEFDNVAAELREKLQLRRKSPILLPPCDYDTMSRKHGHDFVELSRRLVANSMNPPATSDDLKVANLRRGSVSEELPPDYDSDNDAEYTPATLRSLHNAQSSHSSSQNSVASGNSGDRYSGQGSDMYTSPRNPYNLREQRVAAREGLHKSYHEGDFRNQRMSGHSQDFNQSLNENDFRRQRAGSYNK